MRRVLGLMLFCFGIGMTLLLFIPETLSTLIFIIGCLTLLSFLRMRSIQKIAEVCEIRDCAESVKRKRGHVKRHVLSISSNYALSTKPERKQEVHTYIFLAPPLTLTLTDLTFAFQIALDLLWEWLTLFPK